MINKETKEITFLIDTRSDRYYFGFGFFYFFYSKVSKNIVDKSTYIEFGFPDFNNYKPKFLFKKCK